ncbi:MAG: hypothetical protein ACI9SP_002565 [Arenicella sp.]|jgi:hypothetical protein
MVFPKKVLDSKRCRVLNCESLRIKDSTPVPIARFAKAFGKLKINSKRSTAAEFILA